MRRIRYEVAASLDGFIATESGGYDWIPDDPDIDFGALFAQFDTLLMGRRTYELVESQPEQVHKHHRVVVLSSTLRPEEHPRATVIAEDVEPRVRALKEEPGKDIWLFGGGETFRRLLALGLVDGVSVAVTPVLLGSGIPLLGGPSERGLLHFRTQRVYPRSGIVMLDYDVVSPRQASGAGSAAELPA